MNANSREQKSEDRGQHPIIFSGDNPRLILDGRKTQTRRLLSFNNCLVDGVNWPSESFCQLDFASPQVFLDNGPSPAGNAGPYLHVPVQDDRDGVMHRVYPRWQKGDRLWVREAHYRFGRYVRKQVLGKITKTGFGRPLIEVWHFQIDRLHAKRVCFEPPKVKPAKTSKGWHKRPAIFMLKLAARTWLEILKVRVERLQDVSEEDAIAEGCEMEGWIRSGCTCQFPKEQPHPKGGFVGWDSAVDWYADLWEQLHGEGSWDLNPWVIATEFKLAR